MIRKLVRRLLPAVFCFSIAFTVGAYMSSLATPYPLWKVFIAIFTVLTAFTIGVCLVLFLMLSELS